ncbi:hypothetical protein [Streptomyces sp. NBC_00996]|uniref:hypothetical protein n=1 Tax=Streptomyces sp. NBC_00996 TaxID=2903710 RepID=UPI0038706E1F|nr:hypothetical protein OG390_00770 [Streptomyces sp. NBC_00996]
MTASPQPGPAFGPDDEFDFDYSPSTRHVTNLPAQDTAAGAAPVPWHSVNPAGPPPAPPVGCTVCGAHPVAPVEVRAHQGLLLLMRWQTIDGPFCATCGIALIRELTTKTLWQGWWGPFSFFCTLYALLSNWDAYRQLRRLAPPIPIPGRPQAVMGKPVLDRPLAYVAIIPLGCAVGFLASRVISGA